MSAVATCVTENVPAGAARQSHALGRSIMSSWIATQPCTRRGPATTKSSRRRNCTDATNSWTYARPPWTRFRRLWTLFQQNQDLIQVGAYEPGTNLDLDEAIRIRPAMESLLQQLGDECVSLSDSQELLIQLTGGLEQ